MPIDEPRDDAPVSETLDRRRRPGGALIARLPKALQRLVVIVLLGVWCFPATGLAAPPPEAPRPAAGTAREVPAAPGPASSESAAWAARERRAPSLQEFKGGGVSIYIGSGVLVVLVIVLLLIILI